MLKLVGIFWAVLLGGVVSIPLSRSAQQQPGRAFRSGVELVEVDVTAVDSTGRPVLDLRQDEFEVREDGLRRELASFLRVDLPVPEPDEPALSDVSTNEGSHGRLFFLVLDDANSSRKATDGIVAAARELVSRLAPADRIGMLWVSQRREGAREITSNHGVILQALDRFEAERTTIERKASLSSGSPLDRPAPRLDGGEEPGIERLQLPGRTGPPDLKQFFDRLRPFTIIRDVSRYLARLPHRRKAVVYVGEALTPLGPTPTRTGIGEYAELELQKAVTEARRANVSVYLLDPRSPLRPGAEELFEEQDAVLLDRLRSGDLSALARTTGGFAASSSLLRAQIDRIVSETGTYYLLGYYTDPSEPKSQFARVKSALNPWDGFRHIEVRTTRAGIHIRARKGYWPSEPATRPAERSQPTSDGGLVSLVSGLLPRADLRLRAFAVPFRGSRGTHPVLLAIEVQDDSLRVAEGEAFEDTLDAVFVAVEPGEKVRLTKKLTVRFALPPTKRHMLEQGRYLFASQAELPTGHYQLRIGLRSSRSQKAGSVYHDLTVPDFSRPVSLSGIVMNQTAGASPIPVARSQTAQRFASVLPTLVRDFTPTDSARAVVSVYRGRAARSLSIDITTTIRRRGGHETVWESSETTTLSRADEAEYNVDLPLQKLGVGEYRLTIRAEDAQRRFSDQQQLDFTVARF